MGNQISSLPEDVDSVLQDLAQMVIVQDQEIDYTDIINFSNRATQDDIFYIRELTMDLGDHEYDFEDPSVEEIVLEIFDKVKA